MMSAAPDAAVYAPYLWLFTVLLVLRVAGQLVVATTAPRWLPPMSQWQSGLVPYPLLVAVQLIVLWLMFSITIDFTLASGYWVRPHPALGAVVVVWSYLYAAAMVLRYIRRMARRPDQRWIGGTIPIVFHTVVAAFQWTFGQFHTVQM
jgi:hypothetical protein